MTLSNRSQHILVCATCRWLEVYAKSIVHPIRRGFVLGRSRIDCILDLETEMLIGSMMGAPHAASVLFDFSAAFPSVEWDWIERALDAHGIPAWLKKMMLVSLRGSAARVGFGGAVDGCDIRVRRGIKQGCPTSGLLWTLLLDPAASRLKNIVDEIPATLAFFAQESCLVGCGTSGALDRCAWLRLSIAKTKVVHFGKRSPTNTSAGCSASACTSSVSRWCAGPPGFLSRIRHMRNLGPHLQDRLRGLQSSFLLRVGVSGQA